MVNYKICEVTSNNVLKNCSVEIINKSFLTVAKELNLTKENAPTNPAFITYNSLLELKKKEVKFFELIVYNDIPVGFIAIEKADENIFYLEKLAVLPEHRHNGYGKLLMDFAFNYVKKYNGKKISIGIVDENKKLKNWYKDYGFKETGKKKFEHLPFTVCFLEKSV